MAQSGHIQSIYKSRKNILEHLRYQGFNINDYTNFSINEVYTMYQNKQLDMLLTRNKNEELGIPSKKVYVKYHLVKSLRPNNINEYLDELFNIDNTLTIDDDLIIIIKDEPNDTIIKSLKQIFWSTNQFVIIWFIDRLQFNILEHSKVPRHVVLNTNEESDVMKRYNISSYSEFPTISRFDPVAMAIGLRPKQICKIIRASRTSINTNFYRICVNEF
jgi:DNA-directed RNA polymerase subunit H (RpoH/RPB5)